MNCIISGVEWIIQENSSILLERPMVLWQETERYFVTGLFLFRDFLNIIIGWTTILPVLG